MKFFYSKIKHSVVKTRRVLQFVLIGIISSLLLVSQSHAKQILVYGDSLSAAYGMELEQGWVSLLATKLGSNYTINNASISGETTVGGLARIEETLKEFEPDLLFLELGANDGLRGSSPTNIQNNLTKIIQKAKAKNIEIILAGISLPASYGPRYIDQFRESFRTVSKQENTHFVDLYIESMISQPGMIQGDGLHPTAEAQIKIADFVLQYLLDSNLVILE